MSHFTVLVIGYDYEGQLSPYDESIRAVPYRRYWDDEDLQWREESLTEPPTSGDAFVPKRGKDGRVPLEDLVRAYNERWASDDGDQAFLDPEGGIYQMTTYNPHAKWDWYSVGGRWRGYFKLKDGGEGEIGESGVGDNNPTFDADQCLKGDVDVEYMRDVRGDAAGALWDRAQVVFGDLPEARPWKEFYADALDPETANPRPGAIEEARTLYGEQPRVVAMRAHDKEVGWQNAICDFFGPRVEDFQGSREEYVQDARDATLPTFAYVYRGEWFAPGKMGMFGLSSDEEADRKVFRRAFNEFFDSLPDDTQLTLVDCHI